MLLPMMVGIIYGEHTSVYFLITAAILTAIYLLFGRKCPDNMTIYAKEGLIIVATAWIFWSLAGALPFVLSKSIPSYVDAFFETVSGFTTTGSTILTEIEGLPKGILFCRSLTSAHANGITSFTSPPHILQVFIISIGRSLLPPAKTLYAIA